MEAGKFILFGKIDRCINQIIAIRQIIRYLSVEDVLLIGQFFGECNAGKLERFEFQLVFFQQVIQLPAGNDDVPLLDDGALRRDLRAVHRQRVPGGPGQLAGQNGGNAKDHQSGDQNLLFHIPLHSLKNLFFTKSYGAAAML